MSIEITNEQLNVIYKFINSCNMLLDKFNSHYKNIKWHRINENDARIYLYYDAELILVKKCVNDKNLRKDIVFNLILCRLFVMCSKDKNYIQNLFDTYEYKWWKKSHTNDFLKKISKEITKSNWSVVKKMLSIPIPGIYKELNTLYDSEYIE